MPLKSLKIPQPPPSGSAGFDSWAREVTNVINGLPLSIISTADGPNSSNVTAPIGFIGIEIGSSSTPLWIKFGSGATYWSALSHIPHV